MSSKAFDTYGSIVNIDFSTYTYKANANSANEVSFTVYKEVEYNGKTITCKQWDRLVDLGVIYIKDYDEYFEIKVALIEEDATYKQIIGTSLLEAELSQIKLYDIEINTKEDIDRDDYTIPTNFYRENVPGASLLNRLLADKAPHYKIGHVDDTLMSLQRSESINGTTLYDQLVNDETLYNCIFMFRVTDKQRYIDAYDMYYSCPDCGYRSGYMTVCPKCGSTNIKSPYGEYTNIYIDKNNISESTSLTTSSDELKNCFRLVTGDEDMDAAVMSINPNGSRYLYHFSDNMMNTVSTELRDKLVSYNALYDGIIKDTYVIDDTLRASYDAIVNKYNSSAYSTYKYNSQNEKVLTANTYMLADNIVGYDKFVNLYYDVIDLYSYLNDSLMPVVQVDFEKSQAQIDNIVKYVDTVAVSDYSAETTSLATIESAVKLLCKAVMVGSFDIDVTCTLTATDTYSCAIKVTARKDTTDTASTTISVTVTADYTTFITQKIEKAIKETTSLGDIFDIIEYDITDDGTKFKNFIKFYSVERLKSFNDAIQSGLDVIIEDNYNNEFDTIYNKYYLKKTYIQDELTLRESEAKVASDIIDNISAKIDVINAETNIKTYINDDSLWNEFNSYRREDEYSNDNFISTDLTNSEIIKRAKEFYDDAIAEIDKASREGYTISSTLHNLLLIEEFQGIIDYFDVFNWITFKVEGNLYRLRIMSYTINYSPDNASDIEVEFSTARRGIDTINPLNDIKQVIDKAQSMSTNYSAIVQSTLANKETTSTVSEWQKDGLNATNTKIISGAVVFDRNGILVRSYDDINDKFSDEQLKIVNSTIAMTTDSWKSIKTAFGKYIYTDSNNNQVTAYGLIADTIVGKFILGDSLKITNPSNTVTIDSAGITLNSTNSTGTYNNVFTIKRNGVDRMFIDDDGNVNINDLVAANGTFSGVVNASSGTFNGTINASSGTFNGTINATGGTFSGNITSTGTISGGTISGGTISGGTISGGTISGSTLSGTTITGSSIKSTQFEGEDFIIKGDGDAGNRWASSIRFNCSGDIPVYPYIQAHNCADEPTVGDLTLGDCNVITTGNLSVQGTKNRIVKTEDYGYRLLNAIESPSAFFQDYGSCVLDDSGKATIAFDYIFKETINLKYEYFVLLTITGEKSGNCRVYEKTEDYFKIIGDPYIKVDWCVICKQKDYEDKRLDTM